MERRAVGRDSVEHVVAARESDSPQHRELARGPVHPHVDSLADQFDVYHIGAQPQVRAQSELGGHLQVVHERVSLPREQLALGYHRRVDEAVHVRIGQVDHLTRAQELVLADVSVTESELARNLRRLEASSESPVPGDQEGHGTTVDRVQEVGAERQVQRGIRGVRELDGSRHMARALPGA